MNNTPLITLSDIATLRQISANLNVQKVLNPLIIEAQEFDLKPLLGDEFFNAIYNDAPMFTHFDDLWNGSEYTYNGKTYTQCGLKAVLIYFADARLITRGNNTSTPNGMVVKETPYSSPTSDKILGMQIQQAKAGAMAYFEQVSRYLDRMSNDYPLWRSNCDQPVKRGVISISRIRRTR
jgi:hypothetical protein